MTNIFIIIKKGLLVTIFIVLLIPFIYKTLYKEDFYPLKGDVNLPTDVDFSVKNWFSAEYQQKKEEYLNEMFGLRSVFVRANNQVAYSLFNKAKANGVIIGKEKYLYEINYINGYTGLDYVGEEKVLSISEKLKFISDTLHKLNKELIVVFAPGKASFYPEYIPDSYMPIKGISNYKALSKKVGQLGINNINFSEWFVQNKLKSKHPLYPQHGVHWSWYGAALAGDSLIKYIEKLNKIDLPDFKIGKLSIGDAKYGDYDIADGMNLLFKLKSFKMAYPTIEIADTTNKIKPNVLVISDSFYWTLYDMGITKCFDQRSNFWYYNKQVYPETSSSELLVNTLNFGNEIKKRDIIIVVSSETTIKDIGWGFIENAYSFFKGNSDVSTSNVKGTLYNKKVRELIKFIQEDPNWMKLVDQRANDRGIAIDSMLVIEAMWQVDHM